MERQSPHLLTQSQCSNHGGFLAALLKIHPHEHKSLINLAYRITRASHSIRGLGCRGLQIITCSVYNYVLLYHAETAPAETSPPILSHSRHRLCDEGRKS